MSTAVVARPEGPTRLAPLAWRPVAIIAAVRTLLLLAVAPAYGWHRDELYYVTGGRAFDLGYVDHPLLTPWVAGAIDAVVGPRLWVLRSVPALIGCALVVLTAVIARELGGGRVAQVLAALAVACDAFLLGSNHLFQTVSFDQLAWVLASLALLRLLRTGDERWWVGVGVAVGFGALAKATILLWVIGLGVGLLVTPARRYLRSRWVAVGALIALAGALPMLWFQLDHGWPFLEFQQEMNERTAGESRAELLLALLVEHNPVTAFVWIPGWWALVRGRRFPAFTAFGWAGAVIVAVLVVTGGKGYYAAPLYPVLYGAGAVVVTARSGRMPRALSVGLVVGLLVAVPAAVPVLPAETFASSPLAELNEDQLETMGWPELVETVEGVAAGLPRAEQDQAVIVTGNYGEAGALEVLGDGRWPVHGTTNSDWLRGPSATPAAAPVVTVGLRPAELASLFGRCDVAARIDNDAGADNEERGGVVLVCRDRRVPWEEVWERLRYYG